jgi:hypothetical protein
MGGRSECCLAFFVAHPENAYLAQLPVHQPRIYPARCVIRSLGGSLVSHSSAHARLLPQINRRKQLKSAFRFVSHALVRHDTLLFRTPREARLNTQSPEEPFLCIWRLQAERRRNARRLGDPGCHNHRDGWYQLAFFSLLPGHSSLISWANLHAALPLDCEVQTAC